MVEVKEIMRQHGIYDKHGLRKTVEGILYRMRVNRPWRDLPSIFGLWNSVYQQFNLHARCLLAHNTHKRNNNNFLLIVKVVRIA
jgi:transposase